MELIAKLYKEHQQPQSIALEYRIYEKVGSDLVHVEDHDFIISLNVNETENHTQNYIDEKIDKILDDVLELLDNPQAHRTLPNIDTYIGESAKIYTKKSK